MNIFESDLLQNYYNESKTRANTRMQIIQATYDLIAKNTIYNINIKMVCENIGKTRQQFYRYYSTLDSAIFDLVAVVLDLGTKQTILLLENSKDLSVEDQLRIYFNALRGESAAERSRLIEQFDIFSDKGAAEDVERFHKLHTPALMHLVAAEKIVEKGVEEGIFKIPERGIDFELEYLFNSFWSLIARLKNHDVVRIKYSKDEMLDAFVDDAINKFRK